MNVLIIEDEKDIAENIGDYLESRGDVPDFAYDGVGGLHLALTGQYDVLILDVMIPRMDGLTLCRQIRGHDVHAPVLMLTARDTLDDKLVGFETGADDYLVKPFALQELYARLEALVRRNRPAEAVVLKIAGLEFNSGTHTVKRNGYTLKLNPQGFKILGLLMRASPNTVSRQTLEQLLWHDEPPESDALRSHMYALRQAVDKPFKSALIQTVHGIGYRLVAVDKESP